MIILRKLWNSLQGTELKLWHMIVVFLFSNLLTLYTNHNEKQQNLIFERSQELTIVSSDFEALVSNFINSSENLNTLSQASLIDLKLNIDKQISALNKLQGVITEEQREKLNPYYSDLADIRDIVSSGIKVSNVRRFGELALQISQRKNLILREIAL